MHLNEPVTLFKFLSFLWGYNSNLGDQLDCRVSAILQTQALYVGNALLCKQPKKTLNLLASGSSPGMSMWFLSHCVSYIQYVVVFFVVVVVLTVCTSKQACQLFYTFLKPFYREKSYINIGITGFHSV